jgi:pimeloyl-ACP methyl ester carboxylesterase
MEHPKDKIATLGDGRKVAYAIYGAEDDNAPTTFYFHGFPGSHHEGYLTHSTALKHGLRVIAPSRPGYSDSTFQENRSILDYPKDIIEVADLLSVQRFTVLGVSGGGPYAIACLKEIPRERLIGIGTVAGCMPMSFSTQGMLAMTRIMFNVAPYATTPLGWLVDRLLGTTARDTEHPERLENMMDKDMSARSPGDAEIWTNHPDLRQALVRSTRESMKQGGYATAWEARLYGSDWGFKLEDVKVEKGRMILWHGDQDVNVPLRVSERAVELIPQAELRVSKGDSHMSLMTKVEQFVVAMKGMLET